MVKKKTSSKKEVCPTCSKSFADLSKHKCKVVSEKITAPAQIDDTVAPVTNNSGNVIQDNNEESMRPKHYSSVKNLFSGSEIKDLGLLDIELGEQESSAPVNSDNNDLASKASSDLMGVSNSFLKQYARNLGIGFYMTDTKEDFVKSLLKPNEQLLLCDAPNGDTASKKQKDTNDLAVLLRAFYEKIGDDDVLNIFEDGLNRGINADTKKFLIPDSDDASFTPYEIDLDALGVNLGNALKIACDYVNDPAIALVRNGSIIKAKDEESERLLNAVIKRAYEYVKVSNGLNGFTFTKPGTELEVLLNSLQYDSEAECLIDMMISQLSQKELGVNPKQDYLIIGEDNLKVSIKAKDLNINYKNVLKQLGDYAGIKDVYSINSKGKLILNNGVNADVIKDVFLNAYASVKSSPDKLQNFSYKAPESASPVSQSAPEPEKKQRDWLKVFDNIKKYSTINKEYESLDLNLKKLQVKMNNTAIERKIQVSEVQRDGLELWLDRKYNDLTSNIDDMIKLMSDESNKYGDRFAKIEDSYNSLVDEFNIYLNALKQAVEAGLITIIT